MGKRMVISLRLAYKYQHHYNEEDHPLSGSNIEPDLASEIFSYVIRLEKPLQSHSSR